MRVRSALVGLGFLAALPLVWSCSDTVPQADPDALSSADPAVAQEVQQALTQAINDASYRYSALEYDYNEDLLAMLDQMEARLADPSSTPTRRFIVPREGKPPKLDETEELEHFRETIRRWEAKTGRKLREAIDPLKAEVAARKPGEPVPPEFHQRFSAAFDDLIQLEVLEMRERRNRAIAEVSAPLFSKYREQAPGMVDHFERMLKAQGFAEPEPAPGSSAPPPARDDRKG
jgi:hypothetical protein